MKEKAIKIERIRYCCSYKCLRSLRDQRGIEYETNEHGEIFLCQKLSKAEMEELNEALKICMFVLMDNREPLSLDKIYSVLHQWLHRERKNSDPKRSEFLAVKLNKSYSTIRDYFKDQSRESLSEYCIRHTIERAKELLRNTTMNIEEIADALNYSGGDFFCKQFKLKTGMTPEEYRLSTQIA